MTREPRVVSDAIERVEARRVYYVVSQDGFQNYITNLAELFFIDHVEIRILTHGHLLNTCLVCIICDAVVHTVETADNVYLSVVPDNIRRFFSQVDWWYITMCSELSWNIIGEAQCKLLSSLE